MRKPGRDDDGMRGVASSSDMRGINRERAPARVIANCTSVLEGDRIRSHQTLRRAHVLRARAAAYLQTGQPELALADLAAARAQVADRHDDPFFQRSMGLSFDLLEAIAMALTGDTERAATLASNAASARPFALQVQLASDVVLRQVA
ncbi:MAG: hypothetical protein KDI48_18780, partial [Xanthomonadales bacterium]|nr:hypothetical protein [Xanthomonadales bacterium]